MADYNSLKVPELKKLLQDRSLPISGNKADLIARLQENDKKSSGGAAAPTGDDEIDWDEDDNKATTAAAAAAVAAGGQGPVSNPVAVPNQKVDINPAETTDLKVTAPTATDEAVASSGITTTTNPRAPAAEASEEKPKIDFTIGLAHTDVQSEAEKRANRMKRFGIVEDEETQKLEERAKKFGTGEPAVKGLDEALPERRQKRGREGGGQGGRSAKRQTPDRRTEARPVPGKENGQKKGLGKILDDPSEAAKAEARAKRFAGGA